MWWWCKDKNCAFYLHCTHMLASCHIFENSSDWRGENAAICDTSCLDYCGGPRNRAKWHKNAHLLPFLTPKGMLKYQCSLFIEGDLIFDPRTPVAPCWWCRRLHRYWRLGGLRGLRDHRGGLGSWRLSNFFVTSFNSMASFPSFFEKVMSFIVAFSI